MEKVARFEKNDGEIVYAPTKKENTEKYAADTKGNQYSFGKLIGFEVRQKDLSCDYIVTIQCDGNAKITVPLWYAGWCLEDLIAELAEVMKGDLDCIYMYNAKDEANYLIVPEQVLVLGGKRK